MHRASSTHAELAELARALAEVSEHPDPHPGLVAELGITADRGDFTELFDFELPAFLSYFLSVGPVLGGEPTERTRGFLAAYLPELRAPALCDHVGFLLAVLAEALEQGATGLARALLWEQLAPVWPLYAEAALAYGPRGYTPWARALAELLATLAGELGTPESLPLHLRNAPEPREPTDVEGLLELCLSPVLSGVILTRATIAARARDADLPVRYGGRRFAFRSLLEADPRTAIALVRRLSAQQDRWRLPPVFGAIESWWRGRRARARAILDDVERRSA
jgi:hypothetical protein